MEVVRRWIYVAKGEQVGAAMRVPFPPKQIRLDLVRCHVVSRYGFNRRLGLRV